MDLGMLLSFKKKWEEFTARHPKFAAFITDVAGKGIDEGSVIDITITMSDGKVYQSNMRVSEEDLELILGLMRK